MLGSVLKVLYPDQCAGCEVLTETPHGLCGSCWRKTPFLFGKVCDFCGVPLPGPEDDEITACDDCLGTPRPWVRGWAPLAYEGLAKSIVLRLKHGDRVDLARPAAGWMAERLSGKLDPSTVVVPVPVHPVRLVQRRYNQAALLARGVAGGLGLELSVDALGRPKATPKLDGLTVDERYAKLNGAIGANFRRARKLAGRPVLLVDDVMTSGATLTACTDALLQSGSGPVSIAVLARVLKTP